jgi:hypothetical protein
MTGMKKNMMVMTTTSILRARCAPWSCARAGHGWRRRAAQGRRSQIADE